VLDETGLVLAAEVLSQGEHAVFGGVVPEIAARAHLHHLPAMVARVLGACGLEVGDLAACAATSGPGLIGGLIVGACTAKGIALARGIPFVAVNHLEAHALTARLPGLVPGGAAFPYLLLLVSGGHCQLCAVRGVGDVERLGGTIDDAVGEAFDKVGKMLGLGWPGGPALERLAREGDADAVLLPRPMVGRKGCDFSFSGLKTAVARQVGAHAPRDIAASFQRAVAEVLADRTANALARFPEARLMVVAGGVAANAAVRAALAAVAARAGVTLVAPPPALCTDNAVMVAWAAMERLRLGHQDLLDHAPRPRWPLDAPDMRVRPAA
jgi:N6-L-threonylcarbamoyladenine synthase